ncbi:MAG: 2-oxoglutarate dehydrogenase E1 component [Acidobacteria bacterium]|nr:MAG: 2-oxoglutarate dehydrogenase E1 component [Acidobacteriota bacterium]
MSDPTGRAAPPEPNVLSLAFVEELYARYLRDPSSVPAPWRAYFDRRGPGEPDGAFEERPQIGPSLSPGTLFAAAEPRTAPKTAIELQDRVDQLIRAYRNRGHMVARIDPLGRPREPQPELDPAHYGFTEEHMDLRFSVDTIHGARMMTLREIVRRMQNTYCRSIGVQFNYIENVRIRRWLAARMESTENRLPLSRDDQWRILTRLTDAVIFEEFIQKKFVGAKSFSLEGAETLIPLLDLAIEKSGRSGIAEIVIGMAHRGRLNVLANILGKSPRWIFREFRDTGEGEAAGDVKYHLGYSRDWVTSDGRTVHLSLCFNPSHLEFVDPVAMGRLRAKQDRAGDARGERGLLVLIHGDAAFAGEGVVQETLNMSRLPAYQVGGTLHIIVNNQIGFTTPPEQARSTRYATDLAKMLQIPLFHVNGEDPEAVAQAVDLALDFRMAFGRDAVIDMYCFRRRGHNEGDEPSFTQPLLYKAIRARKSVRESYLEHLQALPDPVSREEADRLVDERRRTLEAELSASEAPEATDGAPQSSFRGIWSAYKGGRDKDVPEVDTSVPRPRLQALLERLSAVPEGFAVHPKIERLLQARREMAAGKRPLDWAAAEALAFATLATEGVRVRLTGQDSERGTFSHRHAVLHDQENGSTYMPLAHLAPDQAPVVISNSPLSEVGVLGFEYGYSLDMPEALVIWEAQFGDFSNVAQVIIDQFIASAEAKWNRLSGLVLLLPHGFEGMGPEHSSARLERFLMLAVRDNMQVVNLTTPAQFFHCLRRQVLRPWRKPLVVMSPKSLLRHPRAVSSLDALAAGRFARILPDPGADAAAAPPDRILICSGKIYYELVEAREALGRSEVPVIRVEQLYPLSNEELRGALAGYPRGTRVLWVQEEPSNMGAWPAIRLRFGDTLFGSWPLELVSRPPASSPATGSASRHRREQQEILERAFA